MSFAEIATPYNIKMESCMAFLRDGKDWYICEMIMLSVHLFGAVVLLILNIVQFNIPYGRYTPTGSLYGFSILVPSKIAWFLQELPSVVVPLFCLLNVGGAEVGELNPNIVLLGMFLMHYIQRTFIYPFLLTTGSKANNLLLVLAACIFCTANGYLQGRALTQFYHYDINWFWSPPFIIGLVVFLTGMAINLHSDSILRNLRKPGETGYKIPRGGLFEYVSSANYFGETVEWIGYAIACWNLPAAMFAIFTACMIGSRAVDHHKYYLKKMEDYPKSRKAFIPFIL